MSKSNGIGCKGGTSWNAGKRVPQAARTREIRAAIKHLAGASVRTFRGQERSWASVYVSGFPDQRPQNIARMLEAKACIEAAGYRCECNGKRGTEGEYFIDVFEKR